jgi:hypothetical protein
MVSITSLVSHLYHYHCMGAHDVFLIQFALLSIIKQRVVAYRQGRGRGKGKGRGEGREEGEGGTGE